VVEEKYIEDALLSAKNSVSSDTVLAFVYVLLRDYLPAGKVEQAIRDAVTGEPVAFVDSFLAQYADSLTNVMLQAKLKGLEGALEKAFMSNNSVNKPSTNELDEGEVESLSYDKDALANLKSVADKALIESIDTEDVLEKLSRNKDLGLLVDSGAPEHNINETIDRILDCLRDIESKDTQSEDKVSFEEIKENLQSLKIKDSDELDDELKEPNDTESEGVPNVSRGNLDDVKDGKAFPEALADVFDEEADDKIKEIALDKVKQKIKEVSGQKGVFRRNN